MVAELVFKPRVKQIETPGYSGYIRALKARRVYELQKLSGATVPDDFIFGLVSDSLCNEHGETIVTKEQASDELDILTAQELMDEILEFNKVTKKIEENKADLKNAQQTKS